MFSKSALKITDYLVQNRIISESDSEIYSFGFKAGFAMLANIAITLAIGVIMGMLLESLLMLAIFVPLRSCAGGVHASNNIKCLLLSVIAVFLVLIMAREASGFFNDTLIFIIGVVCSIIIFILAPVQDANKPLNKDDCKVLKRRSLKALCIELSLFLMLLYLGFKTATIVFILTLSLTCLSVCIGALKNYWLYSVNTR